MYVSSFSPFTTISSLEDGSKQSKQGLVCMEQLSPHANNMGTTGISARLLFFFLTKLPTDFPILQSAQRELWFSNKTTLIRQFHRREASSKYVI